jgi:hypothetical protein
MKNVLFSLAAAALLAGPVLAEGKAHEGKAHKGGAHHFPALEKAKHAVEAAMKAVESSRKYHADKGTLGGHGTKAEESLKAALAEIEAAEQFAKEHHEKAGAAAAPAAAPAK